ncbi:hypothetical protein SAMN06265784_10584 [Paraburkholderia susongensis]|uniref:Uncharacterized protein n=1 Tax=Paraburkholderia susongensis TaxID=1515439 RepID=A0A1X7L6D3_9BURK|nr:hypothetical protein SAMN06265784_10584 [Paraburkholderia susongensis]
MSGERQATISAANAIAHTQSEFGPVASVFCRGKLAVRRVALKQAGVGRMVEARPTVIIGMARPRLTCAPEWLVLLTNGRKYCLCSI